MIYMDNAATTNVSPAVFEAMKPYLTEVYGNPSSVHYAGREAKKAVESARRAVASAIGADAREIYFTSCGSEADTWAILGTALSKENHKRTFVTSVIEHKAVLNAAELLSRMGFTVNYAPVDKQGRVKVKELSELVTPDTFLVSVMTANNEVGTIQPIKEIEQIAHAAGALFHTDAVQAVGNIKIDCHEMNIDLLSLSGHKFHAPKGIGALYVREGIALNNLICGGAQERGKRGGTENIAGIVGLGKAIEIAENDRANHVFLTQTLRDELITEIKSCIPNVKVNAEKAEKLPGHANITFEGIDGEALLLNLDLKRIAVSAGSACTSGSVDPSHVLVAMGLNKKDALSSVRFSLSDENTMDEVVEVVSALSEICARLRSMTH